jgi:DNA-directed DNA polymerase III PolC
MKREMLSPRAVGTLKRKTRQNAEAVKEFVFLENHSVYSLCEGTIFISELAAHAKSREERFLSLCDTNGFYGIVNFIQACEREGLLPVIGARLSHRSFDGILIARNREGYSMICRLVSMIHLDKNPDIARELAHTHTENCFIITSDRRVLSEGGKNVFAEINVRKKNHAEDYTYAKLHGIRPVLIYPVYYLKKKDRHIHLLLRAINQNKKLSSLMPEDVQDEHAFPPDPEDILSVYSWMAEAVRNTVWIAEHSTFHFSMGAPILPKYGNNSFSRLKALCLNNLKKRYQEVTPQVLERLARELKIIHDKRFSGYFLVVHDIVKQSAYTCGRGSAAASIVSYLLFITHVDPIRHNLFFERFLNETRPDPPDIDVDFPWDTRDEILDYIFKKYSTENSAMVANHVTFSARSCVREVAKVYGVPEPEIRSITKNIRSYYSKTTDDFENSSVNKNLSLSMRKVIRDAVDIHGRPRYLSVHCGGVVVTPRPVSSYIPVERASKGVILIQLEKDQAEDFGFVKIDVLGNRSLSVVRDTIELVNLHYGKALRYETLNPLEDEKTVQMLAEGNTIGVFYVESPAMRQLQKKTKRGDYEHLVIHSSIIRPAANRYIREYVERLHGKPFRPLLPEMGEILKETYGIMCYQEDIIKIAMKGADFSLGEACELRKIISKKRKEQRKLQLKEKLFRNLEKKGVKGKIIEQIWNMIESFSGYSFCKPHSASYALLSFKSCYLKAHFPAEFMGAVLKNQGGYYSPLAYISEARRLGLRVVKPDINTSKNEYFGTQGTVYIGFMQIKNLSQKIVTRLLEERSAHGCFRSLLDFMDRTGAGTADTSLLIKAGCFRNIEPYNQPQLLYLAHVYHGREGKNQKDLRDIFPHERVLRPPALKDIPFEQKIQNEIDLYGFIVSMQPMEYWRKYVTDPYVIQARELPDAVGKEVKVAGILITAKTVPTKNDELMQFISFEDETALFETVFFPRAFETHTLGLAYQEPYVLHGKVTAEFGVVSLIVEEALPVAREASS